MQENVAEKSNERTMGQVDKEYAEHAVQLGHKTKVRADIDMEIPELITKMSALTLEARTLSAVKAEEKIQ